MVKATAKHQETLASILEEEVDDEGSWARPQPVPVGTYVAMVKGFRHDRSSQKQTEFLEFQLQLLEAQKDVNETALEEMGGLEDKIVRDTYYLTDGAKWRLREFFVNCGLDPVGKSISQNADDAVNQTLLVRIIHKPSEDGKIKFANVRSTAKYNG